MMGHSVRFAFAVFNEVRVFGDEWQNAVRLALVQTSGNAFILNLESQIVRELREESAALADEAALARSVQRL